jgi:formylmethanofuran dehydrogenase subunit D
MRVIHDLFLNETANYGHVFLPGSTFLEKNGTFTNAERRIQQVRKVIAPRNGYEDWEVTQLLSNALGYPMAYEHPSQIMDEIARLTPTFAGVSYDVLDREGSVQWPCNEAAPAGTPVMHMERFVRGLGRFVITEYVPTDEKVGPRFPLLLTTGRILSQYNVGAQTRRTENVIWHEEDLLEIHPHDAEQRGIKDRDWVRLASRAGDTTLRARITDRVAPGVVYTTFHHPDTQANVVTTDYSDWATNCPEYKVTAVEVAPSNGPSDWQARYEAMAERSRACWSRASERRRDSCRASRPADLHGQPDRAVLHAQKEGADGAAAHLRSFWDPQMRAELIAWRRAGGEGLEPLAAEAVDRLGSVKPSGPPARGPLARRSGRSLVAGASRGDGHRAGARRHDDGGDDGHARRPRGPGPRLQPHRADRGAARGDHRVECLAVGRRDRGAHVAGGRGLGQPRRAADAPWSGPPAAASAASTAWRRRRAAPPKVGEGQVAGPGDVHAAVAALSRPNGWARRPGRCTRPAGGPRTRAWSPSARMSAATTRSTSWSGALVGEPRGEGLLVLTSRVSVEMVQKAAVLARRSWSRSRRRPTLASAPPRPADDPRGGRTRRRLRGLHRPRPDRRLKPRHAMAGADGGVAMNRLTGMVWLGLSAMLVAAPAAAQSVGQRVDEAAQKVESAAGKVGEKAGETAEMSARPPARWPASRPRTSACSTPTSRRC